MKEYFTCDVCKKTFAWKKSLISHTYTIHKEVFMLKCDICDQPFNDKGTLNQHAKKHNISNEENYHCQFCQKSFLGLTALSRHVTNIHC